MALHDDLLELAIRVVGTAVSSAAPVVGGGPVVAAGQAGVSTPGTGDVGTASTQEAELRRAISTASYALFHLLVNASTTRGVATVALRADVAKNFEHRNILGVCKKYTGLTVDMTGQSVPAEITRIADSFVQLQNARHKADYNVKDSVTFVEEQTFV